MNTPTPTAHKPHILILVQNLPVPFDRRVWMESLTLRNAGYRVSVISPCPPSELDRPCETQEGIYLYRYPMPEPVAGKLGFLREYQHSLRHTRRLVKRVWDDQKFDVIQSCNPPDFFWTLARRYQKKHGVRYVFDHHDLCPELYESKFGRRDAFWKLLGWVERQQFRRADAVISTNESYRDVALGRGRVDPQRVTVVRSGPRRDRFIKLPPNPALRRGRKHLAVYLGVMGQQDGVDYGLRAVRHALNAGLTDTAFTFIGHGDEYDALVALRDELGLRGHVEFPGRVSNEVLKEHLSTADLGIAPDPRNPLNDVSTMNKMVEYMAMGLPIVSFDLKESRYTAREAAVYIPDDDDQAMGRAIIDLLASPSRRAAMGRRGRQRFIDELSWEFSAQELEKFYRRLLGAAAPAAASPPAAPARHRRHPALVTS